MPFRLQSNLYYQLTGPAAILCSLRPHRSEGQRAREESLSSNPEFAPLEIEVAPFSNRLTRFEVSNIEELCIHYEGVFDSEAETVEAPTHAKPVSYPEDPEVLPFLFPSRYAPSDRFSQVALELFGGIESPFAQALAIEDWLFENINYLYGSSNEGTSAEDTFLQRQGVCRDFAHLGIALCRALFLPARYITAYCYQLEPQDFHAAFEVYLDGRWHLFDGTRLVPLNALIKIAVGRDAAETAVASLSGNIISTGMEIYVYHEPESDEAFYRVFREELRDRNQSLVLP